MHPALSIIIFTTSSGMGYGLAVVLGLGLLDAESFSTKAAYVLSIALIGGGLLSSTLHLGNPQRAWRALSQWRSSWLSREGVMAIATFVPLGISALAALFWDRHILVSGLLTAVLATATVYCTAMIYASLRSIDAWYTGLTPACYLLFALAGGLTLATMFAAMGQDHVALLAFAAILALVAACGIKSRWRKRMLTMAPISTPETATRLGGIGAVRLFEPPHMNGNYLTREMGFRVARKHAAKLAVIALAAGGIVPTLLLVITIFLPDGVFRVTAPTLAVLSHAAGMVVERWLFFAEARHAVMNYYGG